MRRGVNPPLMGFKVLDLSRVLAGPWCAMTLGDLGAEVIKVEHPLRGDDTRGWAPFHQGESAYFLFLNRNKKSVAFDISDSEVQELLRDYISETDIIIENYRVGALKKYRLDYDSVRELNPRIIYCSITGYGHSSPMAARPGYDLVAQAEGGIMSMTGDVDGPPTKVAVAIADLFAGMNAVQSVLAAVIARDRLGVGQHIDIALLDSQIAAMLNVSSEYLVTGTVPRRYGNAHPAVVPYQAFPTQDGHFVLAVGNDSQFAAICEKVIDRPELAQDARYQTNAARVANREGLATILTEAFARHPTAHWLSTITACGVPTGKIRTIDEVLNAPEVAARDMVWSVDHPVLGPVRLVGSPLKLSETPVRCSSPPPLLGQHTEDVLTNAFGVDDERVARLKARGVVGTRAHD